MKAGLHGTQEMNEWNEFRGVPGLVLPTLYHSIFFWVREEGHSGGETPDPSFPRCCCRETRDYSLKCDPRARVVSTET